MADRLEGKNGPTDSGIMFNFTPNDSADLPEVTRGLIVGTGGDVRLTDPDGVTDTFALSAGVYPVRVKRVWATGTTATGLIGVK